MTTEQKQKIEEEALSWKNTPYHPGAAIKGAGVSCAHFIASVYNEVLGISLTVCDYNDQWFTNNENIKNKNEIYINGLTSQGFTEVKLGDQKKGDIVLSRTNNQLYCHGGIILDWPKVIHVAGPHGVEITKSAYASWFFGQRPDTLRFFTWKGE